MSSEQEARSLPVGSHLIAFTSFVCPWNVLIGLSRPNFQTWMHISVVQDAKVLLLCQTTSSAGARKERKLLLDFTSMCIPNDGGLRLKGEEKLKSVWRTEWTPDCIKAEGSCVVNAIVSVFIPHSTRPPTLHSGERIRMQLNFSVVISRQLISNDNFVCQQKCLHWIRLFNGCHYNGVLFFSSSGVIRKKLLQQ